MGGDCKVPLAFTFGSVNFRNLGYMIERSRLKSPVYVLTKVNPTLKPSLLIVMPLSRPISSERMVLGFLRRTIF